jgi:predicted AlkP superfamily pyrophosphatase or phosphodiesterase
MVSSYARKAFSVLFLSVLFVQTHSSVTGKEATPLGGVGISTQAERVPLLLVGIDGFKYSYLERAETPTFDRLISKGVKAESLIPVFPSKTFPNMYSIATGLHPENSGIVSNTMYDPIMDQHFSMGNRNAVMDGRWWGGEPIWVTAERQGLRTGTMFWVGSEAKIKGIQPTHWHLYDGRVSHEERINHVVNWFTADEPTQFAAVYFSDPDSAGHSHGAYSDEVVEAVKKMDRTMAQLIERLTEAGIYPGINILVVSDHGMVDLSEEKVIFLDEIIDLDHVEVIDWTPVAMIRPSEGRRMEVYQQLKAAEGNYKVYLREDLPEEYRLKNHHRVPEIVMVADISYTISSRPFFDSRGVLSASHGYDHREPAMHGIFFGKGPSLKEGFKMESFQLVHLYELMTNLLGIKPASNDGDFEILKPVLKVDD